MKLLVADDSPVMRKAVRSIVLGMELREEELLEADSGPGALAQLRAARPSVDLAVVDWDLPGLGGPKFLQALAGTGGGDRLEILFLINPNQRWEVAEAYRRRPCGFIERPFSDQALRERVRALWGRIEERKAEEGSRLLQSIVSNAQAETVLPFLLQLPSGLLDAFLRHAERKSVPEGSTFIQVGDRVNALHVIASGEVEIAPAGGGAARALSDGEALAEAPFMTGEPARLAARARTPVELLLLSRPRLAELLQREPRMADHLTALVARQSKAAPPRPATVVSELAGSLESMSFADVIQLLQSSQKTGTLNFKSDGRTGGIYFQAGEARDAWAGDLRGEEAFFHLGSWKRARFAFSSLPRQDSPTIAQPTMTLLMEAMRRLDEAGREVPLPR